MKCRVGLRRLAVLASLTFGFAISANAQHELLLHSFSEGTGDGCDPYSGLVADKQGNLYGTTLDCGLVTGIVYELSPPTSPGGSWQETILVLFGGPNGESPFGTPTIDAARNLYGTTDAGGNSTNCPAGCGTVYEVSPPSSPGGQWTEQVLYSFSGDDGAGLRGGLAMDARGNLFGTTQTGGLYGEGTIFELSPPSLPGGSWIESTIWNFTGGSDGGSPLDSPAVDSAGNVYGTTYSGGQFGAGAVFEVSPSGGVWNEMVLHSFGEDQDGADPVAGVVMTNSGALAGTTQSGGAKGLGMAYALMPPAQQGMPWTYTDLHDFGSMRGDGATPVAGLTVGNRVLYGTTQQAGSELSARGTVYELRPVNGTWVETILYSFDTGQGVDVTAPDARVLIHDGALFGTGQGGGAFNQGGIYELLLPTVPESPQ